MNNLATHHNDPIDALIDAGVPVRILIGHQLCSVDWLAARVGEKFRLCYFNDAGILILEDVSAPGLLMRGKQLGWHPLQDEPEEKGMPFLFEEAIYHFRNGVHWYASATSDTDGMLPLGFPKGVIEADRRRSERRMKRAQLRLKREGADKAKAAAAAARSNEARQIARVAERMRREAEIAGCPISASAAQQKARAWWRQWEQDVATIMRSFTESQGGSQDDE